jgi:histone-lysine N-methyltransferase SETMAR
MEIEIRAVILYYCRQGKGEKKIHHNYPTCPARTHIHWVRKFTAQRTDLHDEVRPGRSLIDVSAHIARLLNDHPFSSTCHLTRQLAITKEVVKRDLQEVLRFHKFSLKWVPNLLRAEQMATRVQMSRELYDSLIFERQKNFAAIITGDESWYYWSYAESSLWVRSGHDVPTRPFQKIDSKKWMFTIFFNGEKLAFLDSLPKGQNMDSYCFYNTVLEGAKTGALAGTQKATLRDFHIHMDNCKVHNPKLTTGQLNEIWLIRWDHSPYSPDIAPSDFWFFE